MFFLEKLKQVKQTFVTVTVTFERFFKSNKLMSGQNLSQRILFFR
jgi:hypothetical protein